MHPTSLPSRGGIGDFGPAAHDFIEWLASARQRLWQVLPLNPVGYGNSPYSSLSTFAGNPLLISLERLAEHGWIDWARLNELPGDHGDVDYERVRATKLPMLREAAANFIRSADGETRQRYDTFRRDNSWWLEDYVLFAVLRTRFEGRSWNEWPREIAHREPEAITRISEELRDRLEIARALQFFFIEQWGSLREHCGRHGIKIIGDVAIFVSYDSADVWTHPEIFQLDPDSLLPRAVAGVPPDAFSATGQRWGNPLYNWAVLRARGYDWWIQRLRWALTTCDIIRLDHFRGFEAYWEIPAAERTAVNGKWVKGPEDELFEAVRNECGRLPFIAEDLGMITEEVHELRKRLDIPGMKVLQFGFGDPGAHIYLPHKYEENAVVYTGTHDNDTTVGWWRRTAAEHERRFAAAYLGPAEDGMHWAFIRAAEASIARLCVIPVQDVLGLDSDARMNKPSEAEGNWAWRLQQGALTPELAEKLATITEVSDRDPVALKAEQQRNGKVKEEFAT